MAVQILGENLVFAIFNVLKETMYGVLTGGKASQALLPRIVLLIKPWGRESRKNHFHLWKTLFWGPTYKIYVQNYQFPVSAEITEIFL